MIKMIKSKEVLHQALQALEYYRKNEDHEPTPASLTIGWLRQALAEPDTGIDRGAWSDVENATQWVDELRGDEPDLLNQTCCGCGLSGGYALYCGLCWSKGDKPVGYVDQSDLDRAGHDFWVSRQPSKNSVPLYTVPPVADVNTSEERVSISDKQGHECQELKASGPIGEIIEAHGLIAVSIPEMPPVGTKLYTEEQVRQMVEGETRNAKPNQDMCGND